MDLCAAPGSWSQVLAKRLYEPLPPEEREKVKIIAVDLQGMAPIEGVKQLRADISKESTAEAIIEFFGGEKAQIVVSDGAPDSTGMHDFDSYVQGELLLSALSISTFILEEEAPSCPRSTGQTGPVDCTLSSSGSLRTYACSSPPPRATPALKPSWWPESFVCPMATSLAT